MSDWSSQSCEVFSVGLDSLEMGEQFFFSFLFSTFLLLVPQSLHVLYHLSIISISLIVIATLLYINFLFFVFFIVH